MSIIVCSMYDKVPKKYMAIDTCSRSKVWSELSPFKLGPIRINGVEAANFENLWQYSKVYPCHVTSEGQIKDEWFQWREQGWERQRADRYPMGKGAKPLYSWWFGKILGYIDARKQIYAPIYAYAVARTDAFWMLRHLYDGRVNLALRDYDGRRTKETLSEVLNNPAKKMGHAFVIQAMLQLDIEFLKQMANDGQIIRCGRR